MSDLGWRADGIARATAAGGVTLELYRRPGFVAAVGVRRTSGGDEGGPGGGVEVEGGEAAPDPRPEDRRASARGRT